jgi:ABC-type multidrug transport system ATPase subunit
MKWRLEIARALIGWPSIMLFDEPTLSLDPIVAVQVLDLIIRARDINHISSLYVTKKPYEIPYLANYRAVESGGEVLIKEVTNKEKLAQTKVILLDAGRIAFQGSVVDFQTSELPAVTSMLEAFEVSPTGVYVTDPWDKSRLPGEKIL